MLGLIVTMYIVHALLIMDQRMYFIVTFLIIAHTVSDVYD